MLVRINGRVLVSDLAQVECKEVVEGICTLDKIKSHFKAVMNLMSKYGPPRGCMFAALPMGAMDGGGLIERLWPLTGYLQDFGFIAGVCMALWGASRIAFGDPGGQQVVWQSIKGYVLLLIIPMVFFAIRSAIGGA